MLANFEGDVPGAAPSLVSVDDPGAAFTITAEPEDALFVTDTVPLEGVNSLCVGGIGQIRSLKVDLPEPGPALPNDTPVTLNFDYRVVGDGRMRFDWAVSGDVIRTYQILMAKVVNEGAESEPIGGFFAPSDQEQPLFLFDAGGSYRVSVTVDPVERERTPGLRQYQIRVTDIGDPEQQPVVYDSYGFFEVEADTIPATYEGQSFLVRVEQPVAESEWPCLESALTLDAIRLSRGG